MGNSESMYNETAIELIYSNIPNTVEEIIQLYNNKNIDIKYKYNLIHNNINKLFNNPVYFGKKFFFDSGFDEVYICGVSTSVISFIDTNGDDKDLLEKYLQNIFTNINNNYIDI